MRVCTVLVPPASLCSLVSLPVYYIITRNTALSVTDVLTSSRLACGNERHHRPPSLPAGGGVGPNPLPGAPSGAAVRRPGPRAEELLHPDPAALAARLHAARPGRDLADAPDDLQLPPVRAAALQGGAQDSCAGRRQGWWRCPEDWG